MEGAGRIVELTGGVQLSANSVLVASGVSYRMMPAPGFSDFTGAGVYYGAALTEARSCTEQHVVVIGAANSAGQAAVHFSGYASRVTMLVRGDSLAKSMSAYLIDQIAALENIEVLTRTEAVAAEGENGRLKRLRLRGAATASASGPRTSTPASCSSAPCRGPTGWPASWPAMSAASSSPAPTPRDHGWPLQREPRTLETSVPGVFVAGDVRARSIKRVASAVGEGSMAVSLIHEYLAEA